MTLARSEPRNREVLSTSFSATTGAERFPPRGSASFCRVPTDTFPTWTRTVRLIEEHPALADAIGGTPSAWACYRFMTKLREHSAAPADCVDRLAESLREEVPEYGTDVVIDASSLPA